MARFNYLYLRHLYLLINVPNCHTHALLDIHKLWSNKPDQPEATLYTSCEIQYLLSFHIKLFIERLFATIIIIIIIIVIAKQTRSQYESYI